MRRMPRFLKIPSALFLSAILITTLVYQFPVASVIDVGSGRDAPFVHGFSFRESLPDGANARWSNGRAEIRFIGIGAQDGTLALRFAAPRPQNPAQVKIFTNGVEQPVAPSNDFQEFIFPISRARVGVGGNLIVALNSDTFTQPPDSRPLGLFVESARFEANGAPVIPSPRALFYFSALVVLFFAMARVWGGNARVALLVGIVALFIGGTSLYRARVETAYFLAPLFWVTLLLCASAYVFSVALKRLTNILPAPVLSARTLRLLFLAMALAFSVRMFLATGTGYVVDVQDYVVWSYKTVTYGIGSAYVALDGLWSADNPPAMVYVFDVMGRLYREIFAPDFLYPAVAGDPSLRALSTNVAVLADPTHRTLLRIPFLLADVITGALIFVAARKTVSERAAWSVACAFWLNPAVLWNGTYWGQTDALHSLLVLSAFLLLNVNRVGAGFLVYGIAALVKPQAVIFAPLLLVFAYKRPLSFPLGKGGNWRAVARAILFGALGAALMLAPMILFGGAVSMLNFFQNVAGFHPVLSANAHNVWWLVTGGNVGVSSNQAVFAGAPLSFRALSVFLFGALYLAVLWQTRRAAADDFFAWGAFLAFAFFMLVTEIHENHGYAALPLLAIAMTRDRNLRVGFVALSATMLFNYALQDPPLLAQFPALDSNALRWVNAFVNVLVLLAGSIYLFAPANVISNRVRNLGPTEIDFSLRSK